MTNVVSDLLPVCVPETKGRSLEDMDAVFGDKAGSEEVQDRKRITQSLLDAHKLASKDALPSP